MVQDKSNNVGSAIPEKILEIAFDLRQQMIDWDDASTIPPGAAPLLAWILHDPNRIAVLEQWQRHDDELRQSLHRMPVPAGSFARSMASLAHTVKQGDSTSNATPPAEPQPSHLEPLEDPDLQLQPLEPTTRTNRNSDTVGGSRNDRKRLARSSNTNAVSPESSRSTVDWQRLHQKYQEYQINSPRSFLHYCLGIALAASLLVAIGLGVLAYLQERPPETIASLASESQQWLEDQTRNVVWENNWSMFATTFPPCDGLNGQPQRARQFQSRFGKVTVFDYSPGESRPAFLFVIDSDNKFQLPDYLPVNPNFRRDNESLGGFLSKKYVYLLAVQGDTKAYQSLLTMHAGIVK